MLACDRKHQPNPLFTNFSSPSPYNLQLQLPHSLPYSTSTPSPSDFNGRLFQNCYEPSPSIEIDSNYTSSSSATSQYMSGNYTFPQNPAIRVQDATPTPAYPLSAGYHQQTPPVDNNVYSSNLWSGTFDSGEVGGGNTNARMVATGTPGLQISVLNRRSRPHQRALSSSSIGSAGSNSSLSQSHATSYPNYVSEPSPSPSVGTASKMTQSYGLDGSRSYSNHLPTPTQTPTQDSFTPTTYPTYSHQHGQSIDSATAASMAMNRAMMDVTAGEEEVPGMSHSGRHSVSSMGQEPSTPHTVVGDGFDDGFKVPSHDTIVQRQMVPKLDRTMSDVYQDELYNPTTAAATMPSSIPKSNPTFLSPFRNKVSDALQAAQFARSQSPTSQASRGVSPFRPDSPYVHDVSNERRLQAASRVQSDARAQSESMDMSHHSSPQQDDSSRPKTISPKDAVLEYRADEEDTMAHVPLFPGNTPPQRFRQQLEQYAGQNYQSAGQAAQFPQPGPNFGTFATGGSRADNWSDASRQNPPHTSHFSQQQQFPFATPTASAYSQPSFSFTNQNFRQTAAMPSKHDDTPEFPAHLTSMESSASEAPPSSNTSNAKNQQFHAESTATPNNNGIQKPADNASLADTGTYTCTYHGCSLRFETPQKLQKHKREGHRQLTAQQQHTPGVGSGMTSAQLLARNSQAGPHKCERTNPTTGKPCNTVFSRPYDLTRHEDTIHNARKQKVRCALCVEEKTFSRNDALTRHMRVVHPEVDFPGKHRRRGAHD